MNKSHYALLFFFVLSATAWAGVVIESNITLNYGGKPEKMKILGQYEGNKCRVEVPVPGNAKRRGRGVMLFHGDKDRAYLVNLDEKSYLEITPQIVAAMKRERERMIASVKEQLKAMNPKQRKEMEAMMPDYENEGKQKMVFSKLGKKKVGRWSCTRSVGKIKNKRVVEICSVPMEKIGVKLSDFDALKRMSDMMSGFSTDGNLFGWDRYLSEGFPVEILGFDDTGKKVSTQRIIDVKRKRIGRAAFTLPAKFKKTVPSFTNNEVPPPPMPQ